MASKPALVLRTPSCSARTSSLSRLRPRLYVEYHHRIAAAIEHCIPIQQVLSCDGFACQLLGRERTLLRATAIAYEIKRELRTVGITLRCSVGLAPNRLLAKIAGDMQKPDGLMIFERRYLPQALYSLEFADIPGIGSRMEQRILAEGITTMRHSAHSHTSACTRYGEAS